MIYEKCLYFNDADNNGNEYSVDNKKKTKLKLKQSCHKI